MLTKSFAQKQKLNLKALIFLTLLIASIADYEQQNLFACGQQNGPPKILPIAAADNYPEASTVNLICTVSAGQRQTLTLQWLKNEQLLSTNSPLPDDQNVSIENTGVDISILRIHNATHANTGKYTCFARNALGEDSTSVNIVINVETKWTKVPSDVDVALHKDASVECDATGQPAPTIFWLKHPSNDIKGVRNSISNNNNNNNSSAKASVVANGKVLKITRARLDDSGLYECVARNNQHQDLRRIIQVSVRGK